MLSFAASHAKGKSAADKIFDTVMAANKAGAKYGKDKVVNAAPGTFLQDDGQIGFLPTVEKIYRSLPPGEIVSYAPIAGIPDYLDAAMTAAFREYRPEAYAKAVATVGGTGALHNIVNNYSEIGDTVLTTEWCWGPYRSICEDLQRKFATFAMFDEAGLFNIQGLTAKIDEILAKQERLVLILNTPAHNPTGYSLSEADWNTILAKLKEYTGRGRRQFILVIDIAYIDYAGQDSRQFLKKLSALPENILAVLTFSMSKGYTLYGQRAGAMIGVSRFREVIEEFDNINQYSCRATWSNVNRAAMRTLATIYQESGLVQQVDSERQQYVLKINERAGIFTAEAQAAGLEMYPYKAGFFLTIPCIDPGRSCRKLEEELIFAVALGKGIRLSVCAIPTPQIPGLAGKVAAAICEI
ncbi:pyridoxal phosphate-dependent aminotransferase [Sporomusa sp.]|uniref:pyridoxal phosphate-dependent aminotransferase n=1 Tax=Sporomusa sp. TaxID=2078658 RepID=UPI002CD83FE5|nr:aminotransferase class I/II-fold pyridoxal phosphate-dependent enzyme [Sporomusa sp.]HWR42392.1 aminotransferase class I/II-fold pyridoxal phosphate-dependent enzyme [Sporomusa sp.]